MKKDMVKNNSVFVKNIYFYMMLIKIVSLGLKEASFDLLLIRLKTNKIPTNLTNLPIFQKAEKSTKFFSLSLLVAYPYFSFHKNII